MGKGKKKSKKKCCEKYLKTGKHCKTCPLLIQEDGKRKKQGRDTGKQTTKKKKNKKKKK
ncbi:MAG: hypothetical protein M8357_07270 [Desulfobulbaceae bacterium]|nr:hypothetical protein [Desulfobulbaceae bacterium]